MCACGSQHNTGRCGSYCREATEHTQSQTELSPARAGPGSARALLRELWPQEHSRGVCVGRAERAALPASAAAVSQRPCCPGPGSAKSPNGQRKKGAAGPQARPVLGSAPAPRAWEGLRGEQGVGGPACRPSGPSQALLSGRCDRCVRALLRASGGRAPAGADRPPRASSGRRGPVGEVSAESGLWTLRVVRRRPSPGGSGCARAHGSFLGAPCPAASGLLAGLHTSPRPRGLPGQGCSFLPASQSI